MTLSTKLCCPQLPYRLCLRNFHFLFLFVLGFLCDRLDSHRETLKNFLLCKYCGADAADLEYIITVDSPFSIKTENHTFSEKQVLVQSFKNSADIYFDVITVKKSNCIGYGEWVKADTWFPGYAWKVCVCKPQSHFLGWLFEPYENIKKDQKKASEKGFYALITENILTEQFSDSLLIVPKSFSS